MHSHVTAVAEKNLVRGLRIGLGAYRADLVIFILRLLILLDLLNLFVLAGVPLLLWFFGCCVDLSSLLDLAFFDLHVFFLFPSPHALVHSIFGSP